MTRMHAHLLLTAILLSLPEPDVLVANPVCCHNCHTSGPVPHRALLREPHRQVQRWLQRAVAPAPQAPDIDPNTFYGQISGTWEDVDGYFTVPYTVPGLGVMQVLLRGFVADNVGGDLYAVAGWDRSAYWLDVGDGRPRLLQALELDGEYVPEMDDYFYDSAVVRSTCTAGAGCTLNLVPYLRYQELGADYSNRGYVENGVHFDEIQMAFVTDATGEAIDAAVLFEEGTPTEPIQPFFEGDKIFLSILAYKLDEPEYIYALGYMTQFAALSASAGIVRANHIPGEDFPDPDLPPDLNAGDRPVHLLLDAANGEGSGYGIGGTRPSGGYAYGGPFALGFTWRQANEFLFKSGFEPLPAGRSLEKRQLIQRK